MILLPLMVLQPDVALSFGEARQLPSAVAGERLLKGVDHARIEAFLAPAGGMNAPGVVDANLVEQPSATAQGCTRRRWTVRFRASPNDALDRAMPEDRYATTEIARAKPSRCTSTNYVHLNPGVGTSQGFAVLDQLDRLRFDKAKFTVRCLDQTRSDLCNSEAKISYELARLEPWNISANSGGFLIWLGTPGGTVTEVRFKGQEPNHVWIN
ncbi:hypothetical protein [Sphingomonas sp.]|uniref:hypothetical protein n=1 Tax=Sphingomonas sp. TaxID=28214 RepID=UPI002897962D|nr:hypothetical protein [Sphingomonas sp.]